MIENPDSATTATTTTATSSSSYTTLTEALTIAQLRAKNNELEEMVAFAKESFEKLQSTCERLQVLVNFFDNQNRVLRDDNAKLRKQVHGQYEPMHPLATDSTVQGGLDVDEDAALQLALELSMQHQQPESLPHASSSSSSHSSSSSLAADPSASPRFTVTSSDSTTIAELTQRVSALERRAKELLDENHGLKSEKEGFTKQNKALVQAYDDLKKGYLRQIETLTKANEDLRQENSKSTTSARRCSQTADPTMVRSSSLRTSASGSVAATNDDDSGIPEGPSPTHS